MVAREKTHTATILVPSSQEKNSRIRLLSNTFSTKNPNYSYEFIYKIFREKNIWHVMNRYRREDIFY
jgi:hypothetical protein